MKEHLELPASHLCYGDVDPQEGVVLGGVVREEEGHLLQLDQLPHGAVAHAQVGQQLEGLGDDRLGAAPVLQVGDAEREEDCLCSRRKKVG